MKFMIISSSKAKYRKEAFNRVKEKGSMVPDGLKVTGWWVALGRHQNYMVAEGDLEALRAFVMAWGDLCEIDIFPVSDAEDTIKRIQSS